jgi:hypothetical protein
VPGLILAAIVGGGATVGGGQDPLRRMASKAPGRGRTARRRASASNSGRKPVSGLHTPLASESSCGPITAKTQPGLNSKEEPMTTIDSKSRPLSRMERIGVFLHRESDKRLTPLGIWVMPRREDKSKSQRAWAGWPLSVASRTRIVTHPRLRR